MDIVFLEYKYHPSVLKIKEFVGENISEFHFFKTTIKNIENEIRKLNFSKKGIFKNISPKYMLETLDVSGPTLLNIWTEGILKDCAYPDKSKLADVSLVYKKENPFNPFITECFANSN